MRPCFCSLLPLSVFDWVVIAVSVCDATTPLNRPILPMSVISTTTCAIFTGLSSFQLVPLSTVPDIEGLHHQKHKAAGVTHRRSHVAYIIYISSGFIIPLLAADIVEAEDCPWDYQPIRCLSVLYQHLKCRLKFWQPV